MSYDFDEMINGFKKDVAEKREKYCRAWLDETGLLPTEAVLIQKDNKFWIEKKTEDENAIERLRLWNPITRYPFDEIGWGLRVLACNCYTTHVFIIRGKHGNFGPCFVTDSGVEKMVTHWTYLPEAEQHI